jgi:hypothetical protein
MPRVDGEIPQDIQSTLTSLAVDLYWGGMDYYDAREEISERAADLGYDVIGLSDNRIVLKISKDRLPTYDEPLAAKIPQRRSRYPGGIKQNIVEIDLYQNGPDWLRDYLIPVEAAHARGFWLIMRYAPPPNDDEIEQRKQELLEQGVMSNEILSSQNWGYWQGDVYLSDYGLGVASCIEDIEIRDWVDIVDEEDRHHGLIPDETVEETDEDDSEEETPDAPPAERVVVLVDVIPDLKSNVREELRGQVVESGKEVEIELDSYKIIAEIKQTEPRSDRYTQDRKLLISDQTRISL